MQRQSSGQFTSNKSVLYARVSSKEQEREGYSIPAQCKLLRSYASRHDYQIVREFIDVETAKQSGRTNFTEMIGFLEEHSDVRILLCEKTDRLYRNFKDYVTISSMNQSLRKVIFDETDSADYLFDFVTRICLKPENLAKKCPTRRVT